MLAAGNNQIHLNKMKNQNPISPKVWLRALRKTVPSNISLLTSTRRKLSRSSKHNILFHLTTTITPSYQIKPNKLIPSHKL